MKNTACTKISRKVVCQVTPRNVCVNIKLKPNPKPVCDIKLKNKKRTNPEPGRSKMHQGEQRQWLMSPRIATPFQSFGIDILARRPFQIKKSYHHKRFPRNSANRRSTVGMFPAWNSSSLSISMDIQIMLTRHFILLDADLLASLANNDCQNAEFIGLSHTTSALQRRSL